MNKLLEAIKRNTALKVFSVVIAVLLWALVHMSSTEVDQTIVEVPIVITGEADINSEGFVISSPPKKMTTKLTISATRSYMNTTFDPASLTAYVDVSNTKAVGDYTLNVGVKNEDSNIKIENKSPNAISLYVDRIITTKKPVKLSYDGTMNPDYYIDKDNIVISPENATVKVPELISSKISEVVVHLDMTNVRAEIYNEFEGIAVDSRGEEVTDKFLKIADEKITVRIPILKRKSVPIVIRNLPSGLQYNLNTDRVELAGKESQMDDITQIDGYINDYDPTVENASYTVTLKLPEEVLLTEDETVKLYVVD